MIEEARKEVLEKAREVKMQALKDLVVEETKIKHRLTEIKKRLVEAEAKSEEEFIFQEIAITSCTSI